MELSQVRDVIHCDTWWIGKEYLDIKYGRDRLIKLRAGAMFRCS